jgi:hypothetical protein
MAQYTAYHSCGHVSHQVLYGPERGRQQRLEWLRTVPCLDCKRDAEQAAAMAQSEALALPALA